MGESFLEEVATAVLYSGLRRSLGKTAMPTAHLRLAGEGASRISGPPCPLRGGRGQGSIPRPLSSSNYLPAWAAHQLWEAPREPFLANGNTVAAAFLCEN